MVWPSRYNPHGGRPDAAATAAVNSHALALSSLEAELMPEAGAARLALANQLDMVDLEAATPAFSNAVIAKACRVLETDTLPSDLVFTSVTSSPDGWMSSLDIPSNKQAAVGRNVVMLNRLTAYRAFDTDIDAYCIPIKVSWREGSARRNLSLYMLDATALALRQEIAGEMDGAQVSAMRHCRGCGRLSVTFCGCDPTEPLPPLPDAE
jgi:hypothetical protein